MKCKTNKIILNFAIVSIILKVSFSTFAVTGDTEQLIHIESDTQSIDMQSNIVVFAGKVIMTKGTIKINADKIVVTRPRDKQGKEIIDGYGNPATFYQVQNNGLLLKGCALHMHYELAKDLIILTHNACLELSGSNITSYKITYLVKERKMHAYGEKGRRVNTILTPILIQDKKKILNSVKLQ